MAYRIVRTLVYKRGVGIRETVLGVGVVGLWGCAYGDTTTGASGLVRSQETRSRPLLGGCVYSTDSLTDEWTKPSTRGCVGGVRHRGWGRGCVGGGGAEGVWEWVRQRVRQRVCGRGYTRQRQADVSGTGFQTMTPFHVAPKSLPARVKASHARAQAARPPLAASALSAVPPPVPSPRVAAKIRG